jgi:ABC-type nitrate/sulfonate/bicarbonate transport system permease component
VQTAPQQRAKPTARAFASVVVLAALGIVLYGAVAVIERVLLPWRRIATAVNER